MAISPHFKKKKKLKQIWLASLANQKKGKGNPSLSHQLPPHARQLAIFAGELSGKTPLLTRLFLPLSWPLFLSFPPSFFPFTRHLSLWNYLSLSLSLSLSLINTHSLPQKHGSLSLSCPTRLSPEVRRGWNPRPQLVGCPDASVWLGGGTWERLRLTSDETASSSYF